MTAITVNIAPTSTAALGDFLDGLEWIVTDSDITNNVASGFNASGKIDGHPASAVLTGHDFTYLNFFGDIFITGGTLQTGSLTVDGVLQGTLATNFDVSPLVQLVVQEETGGPSDLVEKYLLGFDWTFNAGAAADIILASETIGDNVPLNLRGNDTFNLGGGNDDVFAGDGNDRLDGGTGIDTLRGGLGNDTYILDNAADKIVELAGQGSDAAQTSVSYILGAGVEVESFSTTASGGTLAIALTGNEFAQTITGNAGANIINGKGGADTMSGLAGNDTYYVDNAADKIVESAGGGTADWVATAVSYTLAAGVQVEILTTTANGGVTPINLTGNEFAQTITGNAGANIINGKAGADTMNGLGDNDTYYVDNAFDKIIEGAGAGTANSVLTSVSYTLGAGVQVESFSTTDSTATTALILTGNEFAQTITGNAGDNRLIGNAGADTMSGLGGNDVYYVDILGDKIVEGVGQGTADWVVTSVSYILAAGVQVEKFNAAAGTTAIGMTGNEFAQTIVGNAGINIMNGRGGNDTLWGGAGVDNFVFNTTLSASGNVDRIGDYSVVDDTIRLENAIFTTIVGTGTLTAAQFVSDATGVAHDANDRIVYETDTGKLFYDSNGSAAGGSVLFAILSPNLALTNADFNVF